MANVPHPESAPGDFYVEKGQCLACGVPHVVAPRLIGWADGEHTHCIWKKQPDTPKELEQAIAVLEAQELDCHRYAGSDPAVLERVRQSLCDYPVEPPRNQDPEPYGGPHFILLEDHPRWVIRLWRRIAG